MKLTLKSNVRSVIVEGRKSDSPKLAIWNKHCIPDSDNPVMSTMRGNIDSEVLLIAPCSDGDEYIRGLPFSGEVAKAFHEFLLDKMGLSTEQFLVISCCYAGLKPTMKTCQPVVDFVEECAKKQLFQRYVCIGGSAFQWIFGHGKKPSMETLSGAILTIREFAPAKIMVLPDVSALGPNLKKKREWYIQERAKKQLLLKLSSLETKFRNFVTL